MNTVLEAFTDAQLLEELLRRNTKEELVGLLDKPAFEMPTLAELPDFDALRIRLAPEGIDVLSVRRDTHGNIDIAYRRDGHNCHITAGPIAFDELVSRIRNVGSIVIKSGE